MDVLSRVIYREVYYHFVDALDSGGFGESFDFRGFSEIPFGWTMSFASVRWDILCFGVTRCGVFDQL